MVGSRLSMAARALAAAAVLFIAGEKDGGGAVPTAMKGLHQALTGSRYVELAGAGHISNLDDPAGFANALRAFLRA